MKKLFFLFLANFLFIGIVFSQSISPELLDELKTKTYLQNIFLNDESVKLSLTPDTDLSKKAISHWNNTEHPRLTSEKLFYFDKKNINSNNSKSIKDVSKIIRSISTMKGTEYYSNRHKKWEILYHDAYLIDSPQNKNKIPDDTEGTADGKTLYCMQDDNSFGKCYYQLNYLETEKEISVCFDNFEPLKFAFVTAAKPHNIKINLVVIDEGEYFLVYLMTQAYYPKISMLEEKMIDSFNARVDSIYNWFIKEMKKE